MSEVIRILRGGSGPCPPVPVASGIAYRDPYLTAQVVSYRDHDDGWNLANGVYDIVYPTFPVSYAEFDKTHATPFLKLKFNNVFGNKDRFTDSVGGQVYGAGNGSIVNYVIDHITRLGWHRILFTGILTWNNCIDDADASVQGGFSDWRIPNQEEYESIRDSGLVGSPNGLNYTPFNITSTERKSTSTTAQDNSLRARVFTTVMTSHTKTNTNFTYLQCRTHYT